MQPCFLYIIGSPCFQRRRRKGGEPISSPITFSVRKRERKKGRRFLLLNFQKGERKEKGGGKLRP